MFSVSLFSTLSVYTTQTSYFLKLWEHLWLLPKIAKNREILAESVIYLGKVLCYHANFTPSKKMSFDIKKMPLFLTKSLISNYKISKISAHLHISTREKTWKHFCFIIDGLFPERFLFKECFSSLMSFTLSRTRKSNCCRLNSILV